MHWFFVWGSNIPKRDLEKINTLGTKKSHKTLFVINWTPESHKSLFMNRLSKKLTLRNKGKC